MCTMRSLIALFALLLLVACTPEPRPLNYGEDTCERCRMGLMDARFGTELVTTTGKVYAFDSIECLAAYVQEDDFDAASVHSLWVTDFDRPNELLAVEEAVFVYSPQIHSPMGGNLAAFTDGQPAQVAIQHGADTVMTWDEVLDHVASTPHSHGGHTPTMKQMAHH